MSQIKAIQYFLQKKVRTNEATYATRVTISDIATYAIIYNCQGLSFTSTKVAIGTKVLKRLK